MPGLATCVADGEAYIESLKLERKGVDMSKGTLAAGPKESEVSEWTWRFPSGNEVGCGKQGRYCAEDDADEEEESVSGCVWIGRGVGELLEDPAPAPPVSEAYIYSKWVRKIS